jgi:hypothetical protein
MKYNIYAGLGGSFGGATYQGTGEFKSEEDASEVAYDIAREEYESYEGYHGILDWHDIAEANDLDPDDEDNYDEISELYNEEVESWIEYYAVLTEEDDLEEEEMCEL